MSNNNSSYKIVDKYDTNHSITINHIHMKSSQTENINNNKKKSIETLEDFIISIYTSKNKHVSLSKKSESNISKNRYLEKYTLDNLLEFSNTDIYLNITSQLLLLSIEDIKYNKFKSFILNFVENTIQRHPVFSKHYQNQRIINIQKEYTVFYDFLNKLSKLNLEDYNKVLNVNKFNKAKTQELKKNLIFCLILLYSEFNKISFEQIIIDLHSFLWVTIEPKKSYKNKKLRQIYEISNFSGSSIICNIFKNISQQKENALNRYKNSYDKAITKLNTLEQQSAQQDTEIHRLRSELAQLKQIHNEDKVCLKDEYENLRSRQIRRLKEDITLLSEGLHALRREKPKIKVMDDHAERVIDAMKTEAKNLEK